MKYDSDKPKMHLMVPAFIEGVANVLTFGANKYGENNWRDDVKETSYSRTYSSVQRHLNSFWSGEDIDPESGFDHILHAATQLMILYVQTREGAEADDRYIPKMPDIDQTPMEPVPVKAYATMNLADLPYSCKVGAIDERDQPDSYVEFMYSLPSNSGKIVVTYDHELSKKEQRVLGKLGKCDKEHTIYTEDMAWHAYQLKMLLGATKPNKKSRKNGKRLEANRNFIVEFYPGAH